MTINQDSRKYYLKGLLTQLKYANNVFGSVFSNSLFTQRYRLPGWDNDEYKITDKDGIINLTIDYITELEKEVERLQYVARIIEVAKEN